MEFKEFKRVCTLFISTFEVIGRRMWQFIRWYLGPAGGWGVLSVMAYTERLCLKGVPVSGFRCMKEYGERGEKFASA